MMKSTDLLVLVDSVEEAIKFYTEKLGFDIVAVELSRDNTNIIVSAHLKKSKVFITFKTPQIEELAEFSFIKRCTSRCVGLDIEMKKGLDKFFQRCQKRGVKILSEPKEIAGIRSFVMRDPFGVKLVVFQEIPEKLERPRDFVGMPFPGRDQKESEQLDAMVNHLRSFGILRRAAKKYAKLALKQQKN